MDTRMLAGLFLVSCGFDATGVDSVPDDGGLVSSTGADTGSDGGTVAPPGPGPDPVTETGTTDALPQPSATDAPPDTDATASDDTSAGNTIDDDSSGGESSSGGPLPDTTCNGVPLPEIQALVGPNEEISVHDVAFTGSGTNVIHAAPAELVPIVFQYDIASCDCTGCITQGMLGIPGDQWRACFYDGLPACQTASGTADMEITAPSTPGFYPLSFWRTWQYGCQLDSGDPPENTVVAGICVDDV